MDIGVSLLEPCHDKNYIIVDSISDDVVNHMAPVHSSTVAHLYHLPYDHGSMQRFTIDFSDRKRSLFLHLASSCLDCLRSELNYDRLGDEVLGGTPANERQMEVIALVTRVFMEVHWHHEVR